MEANERKQIGFQMYGRLQDAQEWPVRKFLQSVRQWQGGLWLKPDRECWPRPGPGAPVDIPLTGIEQPSAIALYGKPLCAVLGTDGGVLLVINVEDKRIVKRWVGHDSAIKQVAISSGGSAILSYSCDGIIRRWDMDTGALLGCTLLRNDNGLEASNERTSFSRTVAFTPDCRILVSGSEDGEVEMWNVGIGNRIGAAMCGFGCKVSCIAVSWDGSRVVAGGKDGSLVMWRLSTWTQLWDVPHCHERAVRCVAFSPDGRFAVSGDDDGVVLVWNASTGEQMRKLSNHDRTVMCATFSSDSERIVSGSCDGTVHLWSVKTGEQIGEPLLGRFPHASVVAISDDGKFVVTAGCRNVEVVDTQGMAMEADVRFVRHLPVIGLAASMDKKLYVSLHCGFPSTRDSELRFWDAESGKQIGEPLYVDEFLVWCVSISPDGQLVICGAEDGTIAVYGIVSRLPVGKKLQAHAKRVSAIAYSPDGRWIVSGSEDKTTRVWNVEGDAQMSTPTGAVRAGMKRSRESNRSTASLVNLREESVYEHSSGVRCVTLCLNGRSIVCGLENGEICVLERSSGQLVRSAKSKHLGKVTRIDALKQDQFISKDDKGLEIRWRVENGGGLTQIALAFNYRWAEGLEGEGDTALPGVAFNWHRAERVEGEGETVFPGDDNLVCGSRDAVLRAGGAVLASLPSAVACRTWEYDSSRGILVIGCYDGQVLFSRFVR